ncbi:MAG: hypothetical protein LBT13_03810 [Treponema sp.]|jgi:hypothetical protein|nr:hypothetical protein [Treponema sp.]
MNTQHFLKNVKKSGILISILILSSCIGVHANISLNANGSGTITLEYRISRLLESLGKLDGNERWLTVPVGKADFERTVNRIAGMSMVSFSSKDDGKDLYNQVKLAFSNPEALLRFLDATGQRASLVQENGKYRLSLTMSAGLEQADPDLMALFTTISQGYTVNLSLSVPGEGTLALYNRNGIPLERLPGVQLIPQGKTVSFTAPLGDLYTFTEGVVMELGW